MLAVLVAPSVRRAATAEGTGAGFEADQLLSHAHHQKPNVREFRGEAGDRRDPLVDLPSWHEL